MRQQRLAPTQPMPGTTSSSDCRSRFLRDCRWKVIAKRCASSRIRCSSRSAVAVRIERQRLDAVAREHQLLFLRQADRDQIRQADPFERRVGRVQLPLAAVDHDQIRKRPAVLEHLCIAPADHLFHRRKVVQELSLDP